MKIIRLILVLSSIALLQACEDDDKTKIPKAMFDVYELSNIEVQYDTPKEKDKIVLYKPDKIIPKLFYLKHRLLNGDYYDIYGDAEKFQYYDFSHSVFWGGSVELGEKYGRNLEYELYKFPTTLINDDFSDTQKYTNVSHQFTANKTDGIVTLTLNSKNNTRNITYNIKHTYKATGKKEELIIYGW